MRTLVDLQQPNRMLCCTAITVYSFHILIEKLWYSSDCCEFTLSKSFFTCILKMDGFESFSRCVSLPTLHRNDKNQLNTTSLNWIINTEARKFTFLDLIVIMLMLGIRNIKNHSSRGYSKWMDLTAFQNNCSFEYCTIVAKISWTQEVWIGNQLIYREARNFTCLPVISYPRSFLTQVICTQTQMIRTQAIGCFIAILFAVEIRFHQPRQRLTT